MVGMDQRAEQAELLHVLDEVCRPFVGVLELHRDGGDLLLDPLGDGVEHLTLVGLGEDMVFGSGHQYVSTLSSTA